MEFIAFLLVGIAVGFAIGYLRGKQLLASAVSRASYDALMQEKVTLEARVAGLAESRKELDGKLEQQSRESLQSRERAITAEADNKALQTRLKEQAEQMKAEFQNTATGLLEQMGTKFNSQSEKQIGELLTPLRERLGDFQKNISESFEKQGKEQHTLKAEIEKIVLQTDTLSKALRGDVKAQGNWGEVMLERILEESGLRKDSDYVLQGTDMGLAAADGSRQRPDVIINLPDGKHLIVDAKVSLTAYERFCAETQDEARELHLREFIKSVKAHVVGLESRRYQNNDKLSSPDFVLMFMPIEGAWSLAVQYDLELHAFAWGKGIAIVSPTTLFTTLRTVASLWSIERQNRNTQEIVATAAKLYDKFADFTKDLENIGTRVRQTQDSYDEAVKKLSTGRGNAMKLTEDIKRLGVPTSKALKIASSEEDADELSDA